MSNTGNLENVKKALDESAFVVSDKYFKLPDMGDYYINAVDSPYAKMVDQSIRGTKDGDIKKVSFYIEEPYFTKVGAYDLEGVYFVKVSPDISDVAEELGEFDGDTIYFPANTMNAGGHESEISNSVAYHSNNLLKDNNYKIGVRFLGIDAPEIPKYSIEYVDLSKEETRALKYADIKNNRTGLYLFERGKQRRDEDFVDFIKVGEVWKEYTLYKNQKDAKGKTAIKVLQKDGEEDAKRLQAGKRAQKIVKDMIKNASEVYVMIDRTSLSRSSKRYPNLLDADPFSQYTIEKLKYWYSQIRDYNPYRYAGYNLWGQDLHGRFLGTVYLKRTDHTGTNWINLSKYLIAEVPEIEIFPNYNHSPLYEENFGFASRIFKLETYDYKNRKIADITDSISSMFDDRRKIQNKIFGRDFEELKEWTVIIGDTALFVPPTSIRTITQSTSERMPVVRAKGSITKGAQKAERFIEMTIYFNDEHGINGYPYETRLPDGTKITYHMNGLRSLIAQFKFTPFLPIDNHYINNVLNIEAVSLVNLQISTLPDYPSCIAAVLTLQEFDYTQYMSELPVASSEDSHKINHFANTINFEVMRWYYQRPIVLGEKLKNVDVTSPEYMKKTFGHRTALIPAKLENPNIKFYLANEEHLQRMLQVKLEMMENPHAIPTFTEIEKKAAKDISYIYLALKNTLNSSEFQRQIDRFADVSPYKLGVRRTKDKEAPLNNPNKLREIDFRMIEESTEGNIVRYVDKGKVDSQRIIDFLDYLKKEMLKANNLAGKTILTGGKLVYKEENIKLVSSIGSGEATGSYDANVPKNMEEGRVILGIEFDVRLDYVTDPEMISGLRRVATSETESQMDEIFSDNKIFIPFHAFFERNRNIANMPYIMARSDQKFNLDIMHPDVQFISYCYSVATTLGHHDDKTMNEDVLDLKQRVDWESLDTVIYEEYELGDDARVKSLSASFSNTFTQIGFNGTEGYAPQYMGGEDTIIEIGIETTNPDVVGMLNALPRIATQYVRNYRLILPSSPIKLESEITKLMGVNEVVIENIDVSTVPNQPGVYSIMMRLVSMDRTLRNREALKKINEFAHSGLVTDDSRSRLQLQTYFDLNEALAKAEVYPDLELPTLEELEKHRFEFIRHKFDKGRVYPDPDFYFVYGHVLQSEMFREAIETYYDEAIETVLRGQNGDEVKASVKSETAIEITEMNDKSKKEKEEIEKTRELSESTGDELDLHKSEWDIINIIRASQLTEAWRISDDIQAIFLEPAYLNLIERHEQLKNAPSEKKSLEESPGEWVSKALKSAKDASKLIGEYLMKKPSLPRNYSQKASNIKYDEIKEVSENEIKNQVDVLVNSSEISAIFEKLHIKNNRKFKKILKNIIWAAACAATSEKEYAGKKRDSGWKPNANFIGLKVTNSQDDSGLSVATTIKDIEDYGIEFGAFRIKMYSRSEIKQITGETVPKNLFGSGASINQNYFLLDPFYRSKKATLDDVKKYKVACAADPKFATVAFFRIVLYWLKRMIDDYILPNMSFDLLKEEFESEIKKVLATKSHYESATGDVKNGEPTEIEEIERYLAFLQKGERAVDGGKLFAATVMALTNSKAIYEPMKERRYDMLNGMVEGALSISGSYSPNDTDFILLRKFLLALVGSGEIKKETEIGKEAENPIVDFKKMLNEKKYIKAAEDPLTYIKHSFYDMIVNDKRGRMARAFPTFYLVFVDEGRDIGLWKLHDNFYNINSISEIQVSKSRKVAADTCRIVISNLFHTFTTDDEDTNLKYEYDWRDVFTSIFQPKTYYLKEEAKRLRQQPLNRAKLTEGTRIHVRMGYGANAATLPIVFNGQIAEVSAGEAVEIIAQGDGVELLNPIMDDTEAHEKENQDNFWKFFQSLFSSASTPKQILDAFLTVQGGYWKKNIRKWSNGQFFNEHPLGITHFGDPKYDVIFKAGEPTQNIYEAMSKPKWAELGSEISEEYASDEVPKLTLDVFGKTFWDILHIVGSVSPDYIVGIAPFGFRSTIFHGHPRYYYAYEYHQDTDGTILEKRKPYQQYHIYTSYSDIIKNEIKASSRDIKTNAVGLYRLKKWGTRESQEKTGVLWVDRDIYPEEQKSMLYDTQLWAKGVPIAGAIIPFLNWLVDKGSDDKGTLQSGKEIAWRMTAHALKEAMKDMYTGELIIMGDPTVKPHDRIFIYDSYENMNGSCLVEGCVHHFSAETGFTTTIYPDAIAIVDDRHELAVQTVASGMLANGLAVYVGAVATGALFAKSYNPLLAIAEKHAKNLSETLRRTGAKKTASKLTKNIKKVKNMLNIGTVLSSGGAAALFSASMLGPLLVMALEFALITTLSNSAFNAVERWMRSQQVLQIFPLRKNMKTLVAGLNGSTGLVVGSPTYNQQGWIKNLISKLDTGSNGFGKIANFVIDLMTTDEMKEIAARMQRGDTYKEDPGSNTTQQKLLDETINRYASMRSQNVAGYKRMLLTPRLSPDDKEYEEKIDIIFNELAFLDTDGIEIQPRITEETIYVKDDAKLKEAMERGIFKIMWDNAVPANMYEFKEFNFAGNKVQVRARVVHRNGKKIYDLPFLRQEAIDILREIIIKASYLLPGEEFAKERTPEDFIVLNSALKVGEEETMACTGYSFIIEAFGKRRKTILPDAIRAIENEINIMFKQGKTKNKKLFDWYVDKGSSGEYTQVVLTVYPPKHL